MNEDDSRRRCTTCGTTRQTCFDMAGATDGELCCVACQHPVTTEPAETPAWADAAVEVDYRWYQFRTARNPGDAAEAVVALAVTAPPCPGCGKTTVSVRGPYPRDGGWWRCPDWCLSESSDDTDHAAPAPLAETREAAALREIERICRAELSGRDVEGAASDGDNGPWLARAVLAALTAPPAPTEGHDFARWPHHWLRATPDNPPCQHPDHRPAAPTEGTDRG